MFLKLEARGEDSRLMTYFTPVLAVLLTLFTGFFLFLFLGQDPFEALHTFFIAPVNTAEGISELLLKAVPITLCAIGLSIGFRANVWNIGAEGQFMLGMIFSSAVALYFYEQEGFYILPLMLLAGALGGALWAAIPAFLRTRFNVNEILVSLMLTYVAFQLLSMLVHGPMRDPDGFNFPESRLFSDSAIIPIMWEGTRLHFGGLITLFIIFATWLMVARHVIGFQIRVIGLAPMAASYAGFKSKFLIWFGLLFSGALAGLSGMFEAAGAVGQLVPISPGYGFTAIIVAFLGRLHPIGILFAGLVVALTYIGGENGQIVLGLPDAVTGIFQGMLLFYLLASDLLIKYRIVSANKVTAS